MKRQGKYKLGLLNVDFDNSSLSGGQNLSMPPRVAALLFMFATKENAELSRTEIEHQLWQSQTKSNNSFSVLLADTRRLLKAAGLSDNPIVHLGQGVYRMSDTFQLIPAAIEQKKHIWLLQTSFLLGLIAAVFIMFLVLKNNTQTLPTELQKPSDLSNYQFAEELASTAKHLWFSTIRDEQNSRAFILAQRALEFDPNNRIANGINGLILTKYTRAELGINTTEEQPPAAHYLNKIRASGTITPELVLADFWQKIEKTKSISQAITVIDAGLKTLPYDESLNCTAMRFYAYLGNNAARDRYLNILENMLEKQGLSHCNISDGYLLAERYENLIDLFEQYPERRYKHYILALIATKQFAKTSRVLRSRYGLGNSPITSINANNFGSEIKLFLQECSAAPQCDLKSLLKAKLHHLIGETAQAHQSISLNNEDATYSTKKVKYLLLLRSPLLHDVLIGSNVIAPLTELLSQRPTTSVN